MVVAKQTPVGIDLGTTYSVLAYLDATGRPQTARNADGHLTTPSVVLFEGEDVIVGREAVKAMSRDADRVADCAKRDMGLRWYHKLVDGKQIRPEVIQAYVLDKMMYDAREQIGEVRKAVVTVPAYFDDVRRKGTQDAAYMAGIEVLDIINEPQAAALAFGVDQGFLTPEGESTGRQTVLVYDLGGGTFDVVVMHIQGTDFKTLAIDGDKELGGRDWDRRLVDHVAEQFQDAHGFNPKDDPNSRGALWRECEEAKRTLSARREAVVTCDFRSRSLAVKVTRAQFEEWTNDFLARTEFTACDVLRSAGLDWKALDRILLVGGSTRMPMVRQMVESLSRREVSRSALPDEAVAHGAAIYASLLLDERAGRKPQLRIRNVNSHSLGVAGMNRKIGQKEVSVLIPRNTPLPATRTRQFRTEKYGQRNVLVDVVEGESPDPKNCTKIGRCVVRNLPADLPAGTPVQVQFAYAENGRLSVRVSIPQADKQAAVEIERENGLLKDELDYWRRRIVDDRKRT